MSRTDALALAQILNVATGCDCAPEYVFFHIFGAPVVDVRHDRSCAKAVWVA
jgi:hypothetical protein